MVPTKFVPLVFQELSLDEMLRRSASFKAQMLRRRTVRQFSNRLVPRNIIEDCLLVGGTDEHKEYLEIAPCLIVIFAQSYSVASSGKKMKNYYVPERSVSPPGC